MTDLFHMVPFEQRRYWYARYQVAMKTISANAYASKVTRWFAAQLIQFYRCRRPDSDWGSWLQWEALAAWFGTISQFCKWLMSLKTSGQADIPASFGGHSLRAC